MRVFVSSSFEDLREHRAAAIRVLRQLGHDVVAMEDMTAGSIAPLVKVLEMVDRSEAYLGIFAWRYGFLPGAAGPPPAVPLPPVPGATPGQTSITHYEYLRAKVDLSPALLRRWFGEAMVREPVRIADLQRASVVDLLRLLDYPSDFVPVVTRRHRPGRLSRKASMFWTRWWS